MAPLPVLLVVGCPGVGQQELISGLTGGLSAKDEDGTRWHVATKYYTADVIVKELNLPIGDAASAVALDPPPEGLVLLFDRAKEETFTILRDWMKSNVDALEATEVRLCLANNLSRPKGWETLDGSTEMAVNHWEEEGLMSTCWQWCIEEGFEPVEISTADVELDQWLCSNKEDPQGLVGRARDALHSHMWPGLSRLDPPPLKAPLAEVPVQSEDNGYAPPTVVFEGDGVAPHEAADSASLGTAMPTRRLEADPIAADELLGPEEATSDDEEDDDTQGLERMMEQIKYIRNTTMGEPGDLTDEKRRGRAEDLAMQLMAMMGAHADVEDDDDC
mmetsp:Transcript_16600/g.27990  ORF Transcript_16600/g.27990 Transcript_16600/m.27990 type:complete len:332 (+) Transcript_16600:183-1178(+)|eukprot:CAMPEP_0198220234 /NCGR_PEP_ID=MMETSP1445-20131203/78226_1 /TAXON_ID=36898 /ORGANISM="Pyramimonas sp., Strain CCMP2087" /LENGTH=331 /DNA_ID=CAMNT_0043897951 /DNA_START=131 /DNA_END=1126 /DNA_ORIENTATION=-